MIRLHYLCVAFILLMSCSQEAPHPLEGVHYYLYEDLTADSRDAIHRAMSFIASVGGPQLPSDGVDYDLEQWKSTAQQGRMWLASKTNDEMRDLDEDYTKFVRQWSPYFSD